MNCNTRAIKSISTLTHSEWTQMKHLMLGLQRGGNILKLVGKVCGCLVNHLSAFSTEFQRIAMATAIGFAIMGFIGFFVKLIHIPINNIIVYVPPFLSPLVSCSSTLALCCLCSQFCSVLDKTELRLKV